MHGLFILVGKTFRDSQQTVSDGGGFGQGGWIAQVVEAAVKLLPKRNRLVQRVADQGRRQWCHTQIIQRCLECSAQCLQLGQMLGHGVQRQKKAQLGDPLRHHALAAGDVQDVQACHQPGGLQKPGQVLGIRQHPFGVTIQRAKCFGLWRCLRYCADIRPACRNPVHKITVALSHDRLAKDAKVRFDPQRTFGHDLQGSVRGMAFDHLRIVQHDALRQHPQLTAAVHRLTRTGHVDDTLRNHTDPLTRLHGKVAQKFKGLILGHLARPHQHALGPVHDLALFKPLGQAAQFVFDPLLMAEPGAGQLDDRRQPVSGIAVHDIGMDIAVAGPDDLGAVVVCGEQHECAGRKGAKHARGLEQRVRRRKRGGNHHVRRAADHCADQIFRFGRLGNDLQPGILQVVPKVIGIQRRFSGHQGFVQRA